MGTAALFGIGFTVSAAGVWMAPNRTEGKRTSYLGMLGMTSDGFPNNLEWCVRAYHDQTSKVFHWNACHVQHPNKVEKALKGVIARDEGCFYEPNHNRAEWVYHSALYFPQERIVKHYGGHFEHFACSRKFDPKTKRFKTLKQDEWTVREYGYKTWLKDL